MKEMREKLEEINDCLWECLPVMFFAMWVILVSALVKNLFFVGIK